MKIKSPVLYVLIASLFALLLVCISLAKQNKDYKVENRKILLENDSIISINIELMREANKKEASSLLQY